jgi:hypothetical protein
MRVVCVWCEQEGKPAILREEDPHDASVTQGICEAHAVRLLAKLRRSFASGSASPRPVVHGEGV